ncbi:phosphatidate cytidylyltransferase [Candidatus Saccharibacteria bacterium]|nr:phosphatidate cytidylyltransferase [Candidatus Saccharibacteria bacterium]
MASDTLVRITLLFVMLLTLGAATCIPLFDWSTRKFFRSKLWVKVYWWIPIFAVFIAALELGVLAAGIISIFLTLQIVREFWPHRRAAGWYTRTYTATVIVGITTLPFYFTFSQHAVIDSLLVVGFASPLSDVFAFFLGNYAGRHPLPVQINNRKSWEGVLGQIVGALVGVALLALFVDIPANWLLGLGIGLASAFGDIANSVAKRQLAIKDWGDTIPGHGGILDRCASLSVALVVGLVSLL